MVLEGDDADDRLREAEYMREATRNTSSPLARSRASALTRTRVTDPAYSVLTVAAAGTLLLVGTTSTVAISTLDLAQQL